LLLAVLINEKKTEMNIVICGEMTAEKYKIIADPRGMPSGICRECRECPFHWSDELVVLFSPTENAEGQKHQKAYQYPMRRNQIVAIGEPGWKPNIRRSDVCT